MIKALIFDMDDTLVNTSPLHKESLDIILKRYNVDLNQIPSNIMKKFFGKKDSEIIKEIIKYFSLDLSVKNIIEEREEIIKKMLKNVEPMPGLNKLLKFLRSSDYKIALATLSPKRHVDIILEKIQMKDIFVAIVTGEEITKGKPDSEMFLIVLKKLRLKPEECIAIEDSTNGIIAAKRASMKVIGVVNSKFESNQDLSMSDMVVGDLGEVEEAVKRLNTR
jgi:HAD superfamily hydrolase (TIGR01509 family)